MCGLYFQMKCTCSYDDTDCCVNVDVYLAREGKGGREGDRYK